MTRTSADSAAIADDDAARDVERMVHAAIHAGEGDEYRDQDRDDPDRDLSRAVPDPRGQQQREPAVDGDRRSGVSRGVAGIHGQVLEAMHLRPVTVDHERRRAIRRRLDGEREEQEAGEPPVLRSDCDQRADEPAMIGSTTPPAMIEPTSEASVRPPERWRARKPIEALVVAATPWTWSSDARDDQSGDDRQRRNRDEREERRRTYVQTGWPSPGSAAKRRPSAPGSLSRTGSRAPTAASMAARSEHDGGAEAFRGHWEVRFGSDDRGEPRTQCFSFARFGNIGGARYATLALETLARCLSLLT